MEGRRDQILAAAERLLNHYGAAKTTVADIAREAGVGVGTVYLEFPSKDAILSSLAESRHGEVLGRMREAARRPVPFCERLRAVINARVDAFLRLSEAGAHASEVAHCGCPGIREAYRGFQAEERALLVSLIKEAVETGEFAASDPERAASALLRAYAGFSPPRLFEAPGTARSELGDLHDLVLAGLLARR